jgi:hypothetical protein
MRFKAGRTSLLCLGMMLAVGSLAISVSATVAAPVPEIDGSSLAAGLGLLAGAVLILRSRWRPK